MSHTGSFDSHILAFARSQVQMIANHLKGEDVDYAFVARHALTLMQIAEEGRDLTPVQSGYGNDTRA